MFTATSHNKGVHWVRFFCCNAHTKPKYRALGCCCYSYRRDLFIFQRGVLLSTIACLRATRIVSPPIPHHQQQHALFGCSYSYSLDCYLFRRGVLLFYNSVLTCKAKFAIASTTDGMKWYHGTSVALCRMDGCTERGRGCLREYITII